MEQMKRLSRGLMRDLSLLKKKRNEEKTELNDSNLTLPDGGASLRGSPIWVCSNGVDSLRSAAGSDQAPRTER